jgi:hypothetical protein
MEDEGYLEPIIFEPFSHHRRRAYPEKLPRKNPSQGEGLLFFKE